MNNGSKRLSLTNLSYIEEMKSKIQKLDSIRNTTNTITAQSDLFLQTNNKLNKTFVEKKLINSLLTKRALQPLIHRSIQKNISNHKSLSNTKSLTPFYSTTSHILNSPVNDEHARLSISSYPLSPIHQSVDSEQLLNKDKLHHDFQEDSQTSEYPDRNYRTTHSLTSSSSTSKYSRDELLLAPDTIIIGKLYILNEFYPSIDHENMTNTPIAFLGAEKLLRTRIDWTQVKYPLSSYYIEVIIDLILARPSFIREIPKVTKFNLYRSLIKTVSGHLFFDHGEQKAGTHQCDRKQINRKFTIQDLASIHQREFHIINYNITREQRFIDLYENLFQIHLYPTKSNYL